MKLCDIGDKFIGERSIVLRRRILSLYGNGESMPVLAPIRSLILFLGYPWMRPTDRSMANGKGVLWGNP